MGNKGCYVIKKKLYDDFKTESVRTPGLYTLYKKRSICGKGCFFFNLMSRIIRKVLHVDGRTMFLNWHINIREVFLHKNIFVLLFGLPRAKGDIRIFAKNFVSDQPA